MTTMKRVFIASLFVLGGLSLASAQESVMIRRQAPASKEAAERTVVTEREERTVYEMRAKMAVEARTTIGAPYSAEAVTETTQALADGNRINRKSLTRVYRDGEGRTRREEVDETGAVVTVSIVDPVAHVSYVLQPKTRTAYRQNAVIEMPAMLRSKIEAEVAKERRALPPPPPPPPDTRVMMARVPAGEMTREDLGQQTIDSVVATGTRTTNTLAAGAIGNLQPITVVSEQWFSPDLQALVLTKHSDPRTGETTYRLQSIVRAEPDRSLFSLPSDYTLRESRIRQPQ